MRRQRKRSHSPDHEAFLGSRKRRGNRPQRLDQQRIERHREGMARGYTEDLQRASDGLRTEQHRDEPDPETGGLGEQMNLQGDVGEKETFGQRADQHRPTRNHDTQTSIEIDSSPSATPDLADTASFLVHASRHPADIRDTHSANSGAGDIALAIRPLHEVLLRLPESIPQQRRSERLRTRERQNQQQHPDNTSDRVPEQGSRSRQHHFALRGHVEDTVVERAWNGDRELIRSQTYTRSFSLEGTIIDHETYHRNMGH